MTYIDITHAEYGGHDRLRGTLVNGMRHAVWSYGAKSFHGSMVTTLAPQSTALAAHGPDAEHGDGWAIKFAAVDLIMLDRHFSGKTWSLATSGRAPVRQRVSNRMFSYLHELGHGMSSQEGPGAAAHYLADRNRALNSGERGIVEAFTELAARTNFRSWARLARLEDDGPLPQPTQFGYGGLPETLERVIASVHTGRNDVRDVATAAVRDNWSTGVTTLARSLAGPNALPAHVGALRSTLVRDFGELHDRCIGDIKNATPGEYDMRCREVGDALIAMCRSIRGRQHGVSGQRSATPQRRRPGDPRSGPGQPRLGRTPAPYHLTARDIVGGPTRLAPRPARGFEFG